MPDAKRSFLTQLSAAEMKKLLAARERIEILEKEKSELTRSLEKIDKELAQLLKGVSGKKPGRKKAAKKKVTKKKVAKKKVAKKKVTKKKVVKKKVAKKSPAKRKVAKKKVTRKTAASGGRVKLEDVVVAVLKDAGGTLSFKEIFSTIQGKKLFKTKSKNFDNVLRRTLSTTKLVKRAGRGIYTVA